jgi:uncharacterized membrane protein YhhN
MSVVGTIGFGALGVVVLGWLVVSFTEPGPRRARVEWIAATALFAALTALFAHLTTRAWEAQSHVVLVAFGFLLCVFGSGLLVSAFHALQSFRGTSKKQRVTATN